MPGPRANATIRRRYGWLASIYDWANLEGILYADARASAIEQLNLQLGARVLDVACGTGANFALIEQRIGASGELVGVDLTTEMLDRARVRVARAGWQNVRLRQLDICEVQPGQLGEPFDAAVCTLGFSVIPQWQRAWGAMKSSVHPGGRLAIMDAGCPDDGAHATRGRPLAWALSRLFAADNTRQPWRLLERDTAQATTKRFTQGWVTAAAGTAAAR